MRVLIVDDEPLARTALATFLSTRSDVEFVEAADDAIEALSKISKSAYDLLLLDIHMPELLGTDLVDRLHQGGYPIPFIVFVTAHDQYAVTAFEKHAVDYVLKPFSSERMSEALDKAFRRSEGERAAKLFEVLPRLLHRTASPRIAIRTQGRICFVEPHDVIAIEAEGNYVLLRREGGSYLLRESISEVEEKLKPHGFIRVHRSVLVNPSFVEEIQPLSTGEYGLRVKGGKQYTVTRTYKKNLKNLAEFWIGTGATLKDDER